MKRKLIVFGALLLGLGLFVVGCGSDKKEVAKEVKTVEIGISSCCVSEDVTTKEIIPAFKKYYKEKFGEEVEVKPSFAGSGTLTNQIVGGTPVQVAVLSNESYALKLKAEGLTTSDWKALPNKGVVATSTIIMLVREGNPKGIQSYADLAKPGVKVIHSNPATSGGASWAIYSFYGSVLKETETKTGQKDEAAAYELLKKIEDNVISMPESAKQAAAQFDAGQGDALVTYEQEGLLELEKGKKYQVIVPNSTILTDWTVVQVDKNIKPEQKQVIDEFVKFLFSDEAQNAYAQYGFRSYKPEINAKLASKYANIELPFTLDYLGGSTEAKKTIIDGLWKKTQQK
ncbi:substrate-binding domain-containing protein [Sporomusa termitida]|uniref:Sulfate-binding protein n=1 Tax=Sporomusa termitida TaxID=2377 RepID=A0A517DWW2_9FIRM|nr:extracellular solute-binding protein [Sporomusa termitida]QDR81844.1 Sulfate-binding protein [Sporomusa termitida]